MRTLLCIALAMTFADPDAFAAMMLKVTNLMKLIATRRLRVRGKRKMGRFAKLFPNPGPDTPLDMSAHSRSSEPDGEARQADHAVLIGFGVAGQAVARVLRALSLPYVVVDSNARTLAALRAVPDDAPGREAVFAIARALPESGKAMAKMSSVAAVVGPMP